MFRSLAGSVCAILLMSAVSVSAEEPVKSGTAPVAPSAAVAREWAKEQGGPSSAIRALYVTYGVAQALDIASTKMARSRGAIEANPLMGGGTGKAMAVKAGTGALTMLAVRAIEKKSRKAAIFTMIAANVATAAVVANNMRNARRLR